MTLSDGEFLAVWGTLLGLHLGMLVPIWNKWEARRAETADRIRKFNARRGYGQAVGKQELAKAYTTPFKTEALRKFAEHNGLTTKSYRRELRQGIGRQVLPLTAVCCQVLAVLIAISGLAYLVISVPVSPEAYVVGLGALLVLNVIFFLFA